MITAYGDAETKRKALERGADALLTKPIDFWRCARRSRRGSERRMNILFVDDEPDLEALITRSSAARFAMERRSSVRARRHRSAGDAESEQRHRFVVSDINMPRMDGLTLLQKLQDSDDGMSTIIVSAYGDMAISAPR